MCLHGPRLHAPSPHSSQVSVYGSPDFVFPYVPSHLHHMLFELVKNSLRAVQDRFADSDDAAPPIRWVRMGLGLGGGGTRVRAPRPGVRVCPCVRLCVCVSVKGERKRVRRCVCVGGGGQL